MKGDGIMIHFRSYVGCFNRNKKWVRAEKEHEGLRLWNLNNSSLSFKAKRRDLKDSKLFYSWHLN